ncbi:MAG: hypothetical protein V4727_00150 [Verrucomicrobiota bacterium]
MKSPIGERLELKATQLEDGLTAYRCSESGGIYITLEGYWKWKKSTSEEGGDEGLAEKDFPVSDYDEVVKLCPESGTLMTRYRVGHGLPFRVDRSITGGVWLDAGEWEALHADGIHRNLHLVFTAPWQKAVISAEQSALYNERLRSRLGDDFYKELSALREKIWSHPSSAEVFAYLHTKP